MTRIEPFNVSNELLDEPDKLQEQARQDGYLFFRGLIDADAIYNLRQDFLEICHRHGWAEGGDTLMDGIRVGGAIHGRRRRLLARLRRIPKFGILPRLRASSCDLGHVGQALRRENSRASAEYWKNYVPRKH